MKIIGSKFNPDSSNWLEIKDVKIIFNRHFYFAHIEGDYCVMTIPISQFVHLLKGMRWSIKNASDYKISIKNYQSDEKINFAVRWNFIEEKYVDTYEYDDDDNGFKIIIKGKKPKDASL